MQELSILNGDKNFLRFHQVGEIMAINTQTLASIYEMQGHSEEAIVIYEEILKKDPHNREAKMSLIRLAVNKHHFSGVNQDKLLLFVNAKTPSDYQKLEQWLLGAM